MVVLIVLCLGGVILLLAHYKNVGFHFSYVRAFASEKDSVRHCSS